MGENFSRNMGRERILEECRLIQREKSREMYFDIFEKKSHYALINF